MDNKLEKMNIVIGSTNKAKINAVESVFPHANIQSVTLDSKVSAQPTSDMETRQGAINRAERAKVWQHMSYGLGLEGGVMYINDQLYLCSWGALVTPMNNSFTASGARIPLPSQIASQLKKGYELGDVMEEWTKKKDIRQNLGAIGVFTNASISREVMFMHILQLLKGQAQYDKIF